MFQTTQLRSLASRVAARSQNPDPATKAQQNTGSYFSNVISSVSAAKTVRAGPAPAAPTAATRIATATPSAGDLILSRQDPVIVKKTSTAAVSRTTGGQVGTPTTPADVLRAALESAGLIASQFQIESREEFVPYAGPGGGYLHRFTNVILPNGRQENFSTDLMARYPEITVNEIKRMLRIGNSDPNSGMF